MHKTVIPEALTTMVCIRAAEPMGRDERLGLLRAMATRATDRAIHWILSPDTTGEEPVL